jgi:cytochrome P450
MDIVGGHDGLAFTPPAPIPHSAPLRPFALLKALWRNPLEAWAEPHFNEPIVTANLVLRQVALVNDPGAVRRILLDNAANYGREPIQRRIMSSALRNGLLMADDDQWSRQRRILAPLFTRKCVEGFSVAMGEAGDALVARWRNLQGSVIDVSAEIALLTLNVLERTIFSEGLGHNTEEVREAMRRYFDTIGTIEPLDLLGCPDFVPRLADFRVRKELRLFNSAVEMIIANRRQRLAEGATGVPKDILTLLLEARDPETGERLSETEVRANIITFVAAGHETTANAIMWSLFLLSQSAEWRQRVAAEADRMIECPIEEKSDRLVETRAAIEEAIRLYPPIAAISRAAINADELAGTAIKPGAMVVIAPYVLHRHRRLWERPDVFDPDRFLGGARKSIDRFAYMPFGFGPRMCVGQQFALQEATLVLSAVMREFVLEMVPGHKVWPVLKITVRPENGLPMRLKMRPDKIARSH